MNTVDNPLIVGATPMDTTALVESINEQEKLDTTGMMDLFSKWSLAGRGNYHTARAASARAKIAKRKAKRKSKK